MFNFIRKKIAEAREERGQIQERKRRLIECYGTQANPASGISLEPIDGAVNPFPPPYPNPNYVPTYGEGCKNGISLEPVHRRIAKDPFESQD